MQRAELVAYCLAKRGATEDYPFDDETQVFKVMNKLFALSAVSGDSVNLKCDPQHALLLRSTYPQDVLPGYHMNKTHWNTVKLDGAVPDDLIFELVDESYDLVVRSLTRAAREQLNAL